MAAYEIRDPIHSRIPFDDFERSVIDHPFFQRLRFISQLSFLESYVYPGGTHDRFSHCLGAMHVAGRLFGRLEAGTPLLRQAYSAEEILELRRRVRMAGLLHDIGHGPFSHASEKVFPPLRRLPLDASWWRDVPERQATHEDYSVLLIQTLSREGVLDPQFARDVASLIHGDIRPSESFQVFEGKLPGLHGVLKSLISGEVDCDRMDYLLRDSYYCGVAYGRYDIDWLISSIRLEKNGDALVLAIAENGVRAFEDFLLARYHMIDQVYFHKTKAGFAHYLVEAIETGEIQLDIPVDPYEYASLRDGEVIERLFNASKDDRNDWSRRLMNRIPAKRVLRLHDHQQEDQESLAELKALCEKNGIAYFVHAVANELSHLGEGGNIDEIIHVAKKTLKGVELVPISRYSGLLQRYNQRLAFTDFFILREDVKRFDNLARISD